MTVVEFHSEVDEIQRFLHPNDLKGYFLRQLDIKNWAFSVFKVNFLGQKLTLS